MTVRGAPKTLVVVNPASGGGRTLRHWPGSADLMRALGVDFDVHFTTAPGDATSAVRAALRDGARRIVSVGGDGTLNEVMNGFFDESGESLADDAVLGVVPSGTGSDFRRTAGIPAAPTAAIRLLGNGHTRRVDAGRIDFDDGTRRYFLNIADCGIAGEIVARVNRNRYKGGGARGSAVFLWETLAVLLRYGSREVRVVIDGEELERSVQSVVVANGRYFGGGMRIAPHAQLDDGLFDVVIVGATSRVRSMTSMPALYRGSHISRPGVEVRRGRTIRVEHRGRPLLFDVEGEQIGCTPAAITCLPGAIRLCAGRTTGSLASRTLID